MIVAAIVALALAATLYSFRQYRKKIQGKLSDIESIIETSSSVEVVRSRYCQLVDNQSKLCD